MTAVEGSGISVVRPHPFATTSSLLLGVGALAVDATSRIDVSARGLLGGRRGGNGDVGRTLGNTTAGGSGGRSGGSYGGVGGQGNSFNAVGVTYGDFSDPNELGSGGGSDCGAGGSGGGIKLTTGTLAGVGLIRAQGGASAHSGYSGGGGGGRVAMLYTDANGFVLGQITAPGGGGFRNGSAGSVYIAP